MDACLASQSKNGMKVKNRVQREVELSLRVADGRGGWDTEGEGDRSIKQLNGGTGFYDKT